MDTTTMQKQWVNAETITQQIPPPFIFTPDEIDRVVTRTSAGTFALGYLDQENRFVIKCVGRSDTDIAEELQLQYASYRLIRLRLNDTDPLYDRFTFAYASSPEEAFDRECLEYHAAFDGLDNKRHPNRDNGTGRGSYCPIWQCAWNY